MPELSFFSVTQKLALLDWGKDRLSLDLRDVTFIRPFAVIYLGMLLRYYNSRGKHFSLELPEDPKVRGYLSRHNFYERFNFNPEVITEENLRRIEKSTSLNDILDLSPDRYLGDEVAERVFQTFRTT